MFPWPPPPPETYRSSTPAYLTAGTGGQPSVLEKRVSWAANAVWKSMWKGVVNVTSLPFTDSISMTWPRGRLGRANQPRDGSPGGDLWLHSVMFESVILSIRTMSPAASPVGTRASVTLVLPLIPSDARSVGCVNLNHLVPTVI